MAIPIADDFPFIAKRLDEIKDYRSPINQPNPPRQPDTGTGIQLWWCQTCQERLPDSKVSGRLRHGTAWGGCDSPVYPSCVHCNNQGWVMHPGLRGPVARQCDHCFNPNNNHIP